MIFQQKSVQRDVFGGGEWTVESSTSTAGGSALTWQGSSFFDDNAWNSDGCLFECRGFAFASTKK
jgi:hypothetical protein